MDDAAQHRPDDGTCQGEHCNGGTRQIRIIPSLADVIKSSSTSLGGAGNAGRRERENCTRTPEERQATGAKRA